MSDERQPRHFVATVVRLVDDEELVEERESSRAPARAWSAHTPPSTWTARGLSGRRQIARRTVTPHIAETSCAALQADADSQPRDQALDRVSEGESNLRIESRCHVTARRLFDSWNSAATEPSPDERHDLDARPLGVKRMEHSAVDPRGPRICALDVRPAVRAELDDLTSSHGSSDVVGAASGQARSRPRPRRRARSVWPSAASRTLRSARLRQPRDRAPQGRLSGELAIGSDRLPRRQPPRAGERFRRALRLRHRGPHLGGRSATGAKSMNDLPRSVGLGPDSSSEISPIAAARRTTAGATTR